MQTINFTCDILINDPSRPLDFKILHDNDSIFETRTTETSYKISHSIEEDDNTHSIKFIMSGKTDDHTIVDDNNEIISSAQVEIKNVKFDEIQIDDLFLSNDNLATYTHNQNGYGDEVTDVFDFCMGCNGTAEFKFGTPVYIWLLEHMM